MSLSITTCMGRTRTVMKPFYTFGEYMASPATRLVRHPSSESGNKEENKKLSRGELVELARKRLRMLEELNTETEEELVPLVTEEVDMGQFVNIDFDPNSMFKESSGVSHDDGVVLVDFASRKY